MSLNHLSNFERETIALFRAKGFSQRKIAAELKRAPSTISRELRRNSHEGKYIGATAQAKASAIIRGRPEQKMKDKNIALAVKSALKNDHSPELISGRLKILQDEIQIGRQTIYNWIYAERKLGRKWHRYLPRRGKKYSQKRSGSTVNKGRNPIAARPQIVDIRTRFGDWEGDTLEGRKGAEAVITLVERRSRFTVLCSVKDRSSGALNEAVKEKFAYRRGLPRETLTVDQGREFADGSELARVFRAPVYFADAHSPWQKGAVEQVNGLLRRYLPKGFDKASAKALELAEDRLNNRPRKCLGYLTPYEVLFNVMPA
jgi:IS30 family transposase